MMSKGFVFSKELRWFFGFVSIIGVLGVSVFAIILWFLAFQHSTTPQVYVILAAMISALDAVLLFRLVKIHTLIYMRYFCDSSSFSNQIGRKTTTVCLHDRIYWKHVTSNLYFGKGRTTTAHLLVSDKNIPTPNKSNDGLNGYFWAIENGCVVLPEEWNKL